MNYLKNGGIEMIEKILKGEMDLNFLITLSSRNWKFWKPLI